MKNKRKQEISKKLIGKWGRYTIYLVDDEKIRDSSEYAEEFSDYGVNVGKKGLSTLNFKFIPENEIWIAKSIKQEERHNIIENALAYIRGIERGTDPGISYENALKKEMLIRKNDAINKYHIEKNISLKNPFHIDVPEKIYYSKYTDIKDKDEIVKIFLINGEIVRDLYKTDFVEGGHGYVYEWIPKDEIWIDNKIKSKEIPVIILHEFTERTLMKYKNIPYGRAHIAASKVEFEHRGIFNKKDAGNLSRIIVMDKLLRNIKY